MYLNLDNFGGAFWYSPSRVTCCARVCEVTNRVRNVIQSLKIDSEWIDVTTSPAVRAKMRSECGNPRALPPQIFRDDIYLGDVETMEGFIEDEKALEWFGMSPETSVKTDGPSDSDSTCSSDKEIPDVPRSGSIQIIQVEEPVVEKTDDIPMSVKDTVTTAVSEYEILVKDGPKSNNQPPKVVFPRSKSISAENPAQNRVISEERRRKILGLQ